MSTMVKKLPLIVVLGATACGKSKLAIELARRFGGEIISADSMQVYSGLDIVTNKVTQEERCQAKHHMIDFLNPMKRYSVVDFRNKSLEIIDDLRSKNKMPIVVGGTHYYIESILWNSFIFGPSEESTKRRYESTSEQSLDVHSQERNCDNNIETVMDLELKHLATADESERHMEEDLQDVDKFFAKPIHNKGFEHIESEKLWQLLEKVDPKSAHHFHPNDKRKVIHCLQVIQQCNKNYSDLLDELNVSQDNKPSLGGSLRYEPTCVFWLDFPDKEALDEILFKRVDQMLERNLLAELEQFHKDYNEQRIRDNQSPDYQSGIFQSIGFKEFHEYLMLDEDSKKTEEGQALLQSSIEDMKISTRQYARRQLKWIRRRFTHKDIRDLPLVFKFQSTFDEDEWNKDIVSPACSIVDCLIEDREFNQDLIKFKVESKERDVDFKSAKHHCEVCNKILIGTIQIEEHLRSRKHQNNVRKKNKKMRRNTKPIEDDTTELKQDNKISHQGAS